MDPKVLGRDDELATGPSRVVDTGRPLKVFIVGAGIAGLSAAIGLRREGHEVEIFEQSSFANEVGAAIHVCPNASRVVLSWGLDPSKASFEVTKSYLMAQADTLNPMFERDYRHIESQFSSPWYLAHRVDLHNALKELVLQDAGEGNPGKIHLRSGVHSIDQEAATITLADSTIHKADLVLAADGVHSLAVSQVIKQENPAQPTGFSAFRFLIPSKLILADDNTKHMIEGKDGGMKAFVGSEGRMIVWYPCRSGTLQNFVAIHPDNNKSTSKEDWNTTAKLSDVLREYPNFHPDLLAAVRKATDIKLWKLLYRPPIPSWHQDRLLLIGDAAHPMLPRQGQGGAQAIEDGAAIGILLRGLTSDSPDLNAKIAARLDAFETVRRKRASIIQILSNSSHYEAEKFRPEIESIAGKGFKIPRNPGEFQEFLFEYDVIAESERLLDTL